MSLITTILLIIALLWLAIITYFLWSISAHYKNLTKNVSEKNLQAVLDDILTNTHKAHKEIASLIKKCDMIEKDGMLHIQKMGLVRFNPFHDTGGNQSFILSLLDKNDTGIVISGLYSRAGTRWYAKRIKEGKGVDHTLSEEEEKAIKEAHLL